MVDQQVQLFVIVWYVCLFTSLFQNTQLTIQCDMRNRKKTTKRVSDETFTQQQQSFSCKGYLQQNVCLSIVMSQYLQYVLFNQYYTSLNDIALPYESILIHSRRIKLLIALKLNCICNYSLQFISLHRSSEIYHTHMLKQTRNIRI